MSPFAFHHPWRELRDHFGHVVVFWQAQHGLRRSATDGTWRIWMDPSLGQAGRRSALAHELEHLRAGHVGCQPPVVERHVRAMAAQRLLPCIRQVADAVVWARGCIDTAADELWVDRDTLLARVDRRHTPPMEVAYVRHRARLYEEEMA
ncbi:ImmA/IrrE family metallo-endopeptidase [Desertihabitans brevis]|uniref:ImmA/IrrE family metallo-endopeptidase n=1 Tax=Desertihabitans brevis TaxID=2268447 RepID=A0A367YR00_9ACTN|nr:ImmA/IrrE family metallo-endopeptidase [Desertihabitans brevis]RCK68315.1 ImmA/IrrE family metallo-endopeptidase [Desertihabitans brevis]